MRLGLLAALVGSLLLLHFLVADGCQGAGDFLDLVAGEILGQLLGKLLEEQAIVGFLGVGSEDGCKDSAELLKLGLGRWVEERERGEVDGVGRILGVDDNSSASSVRLAAANTQIVKEVFGVLQVRLLLCAAETLALLGFGLIIARVLVRLSGSAGSVGLVVGDTLRLGLLTGSGIGISLRLGLGSLLCLLAFYFGVFSGVPGIEDLFPSRLISRGFPRQASRCHVV